MFVRDGISHIHRTREEREKCECNLCVRLKDVAMVVQNSVVIPRYDRLVRMTLDEMYEKALVRIMSTWYMSGYKLNRLNGDLKINETQIRVDAIIGQNQQAIPEYFPARTVPREEKQYYCPAMLHLYKKYDVKSYASYVPEPYRYDMKFWEKRIWREIRDASGKVIVDGVSWEDHRSPESTKESSVPEALSIQVLRAMSWYNRALAGDSRGNNSFFSHEALYPDKMFRLISKFNKDTKNMSPEFKSIQYLMPEALDMMYDYMDVKQYFRSYIWDYLVAKQLLDLPLRTSSGIGPGYYHTMEIDGVIYKFGVNGKKFEQLEQALLEVDRLASLAVLGEKIHIEVAGYQLIPKKETLIPEGDTWLEIAEDKAKLQYKAREFFIGRLKMLIIAAMTGKDRQIIERGPMIKIGHKWWHGGAQILAEQMRFDDPEMEWWDGDVKGLDTTIKLKMLVLYMTQGSIYYNFDKMTPENVRIYRQFLRVSTYNISVKVVHIFGKIWRIMYGVMPSGVFDTSHGDSWIVGCLFFLYLAELMAKYPQYRAEIKLGLKNGWIVIFIYGDDHIVGKKRRYHYINKEGFKIFLWEKFQTELRNLRSFSNFLSTVDEYGEMVKKGAIFLKNYFVASSDLKMSGLPFVVPYRPKSAVIKKFAHGKGGYRTVGDYVLSSIGMAYTASTNVHAYEFCKKMHHGFLRFFKESGGVFADLFTDKELMASDSNVSRIVKKNGIKIVDLEKFPAIETLMEMHIMTKQHRGDYHVTRLRNYDL